MLTEAVLPSVLHIAWQLLSPAIRKRISQLPQECCLAITRIAAEEHYAVLPTEHTWQKLCVELRRYISLDGEIRIEPTIIGVADAAVAIDPLDVSDPLVDDPFAAFRFIPEPSFRGGSAESGQ